MVLLNGTTVNIMSNFIPNETINFDDRDPPSLNKNIENMINYKDAIYNKLIRHNDSLLQLRLRYFQDLLNTKIEQAKTKYFENISHKLSNKNLNPKKYWSLLKIILNGKRIPCIPPIYHNNKFVSYIKRKRDLFNSHFADQCTPLLNDSKLPSVLTVHTESLLESFHFSADHIGDIIKKLDPNKAHGHDMISIRMLKLCGDSIWKPLEIIFKNCLQEGIFPNEWKKANVVPIHKKNYKQILSNYRPVSLLPVCSKISERLIYNSMYKHIIDNNLLLPNHSGFCTGDSCLNQLLSITYDVFHCFGEGMETSTIFLDISKDFNKVWHKGLIYKLRQYGFSGNLLALLTDFLSNRKQRVVLNCQH